MIFRSRSLNWFYCILKLLDPQNHEKTRSISKIHPMQIFVLVPRTYPENLSVIVKNCYRRRYVSKFVFQGRQLKTTCAMYLHIGDDLWLAITSATNDIFPLDQNNLIDIDILYQKNPKSRFLKIFHEDPPAPALW